MLSEMAVANSAGKAFLSRAVAEGQGTAPASTSLSESQFPHLQTMDQYPHLLLQGSNDIKGHEQTVCTVSTTPALLIIDKWVEGLFCDFLTSPNKNTHKGDSHNVSFYKR